MMETGNPFSFDWRKATLGASARTSARKPVSQNEKVNFSMRMICSLATVVKVAVICLFVGFMVGSVFMVSVI